MLQKEYFKTKPTFPKAQAFVTSRCCHGHTSGTFQVLLNNPTPVCKWGVFFKGCFLCHKALLFRVQWYMLRKRAASDIYSHHKQTLSSTKRIASKSSLYQSRVVEGDQSRYLPGCKYQNRDRSGRQSVCESFFYFILYNSHITCEPCKKVSFSLFVFETHASFLP